ncbi:antibiotic biosynthesis monooxygenase [Vibrio brasiliensis]|uniref:putative quinol monooxygenase n=1 Tax=Vibrio brasiliensis TaxID=170652 RepID=UPI001EFCCF95|nr:putative quinol monooxygenase [Vibrio brasiliensis]MCG9647581.1 antibiotic biosynthesis monooxygenase [Vibrio brasiliensis]
MTKLTIFANIVAKSDQVELVKSELVKLIDKTLVEEGCINYDLHQDNDNPAHFVFYENWESAQALDNHLASEHIAQYSAAVEGAVESFTLNRMTHIK